MIPTRAVKAVISENNKLLMLKGSQHGLWDLPGGLINEDESIKEALQREVREELGVDCEILNKAGSWSFLREKDKKMVFVQNYTCTIQGKILLSDEHAEYAWVSLDAVDSLQVKDKSFFEALRKD